MITDRGTEYLHNDVANCCTLFIFRHFQRTSPALWRNGLAEVQNKELATYLGLFLHKTPEKRSFQLKNFVHAHNFQPLSLWHVSTHEINFHAQLRFPLIFRRNLSRKEFRVCVQHITALIYVLIHISNPLISNHCFRE